MTDKIVICWSGGKDSSLALYELQRQGQCEVVSLLTTVTASYDRISMHGVRRSLLRQQAASLGIPLHEILISPNATNDEYEAKMADALARFRRQEIRKVAFGDIFLEDLKEYREQQLGRLGMECVFPIWMRDTGELIDSFCRYGFRAVITCVDPKVLGPSFAGRLIDRDFVAELPDGVDPCGENGEFHSFVFDGPNFAGEVRFSLGKTVLRDSFLFCDLVSGPETKPAEGRHSKRPVRQAK